MKFWELKSSSCLGPILAVAIIFCTIWFGFNLKDEVKNNIFYNTPCGVYKIVGTRAHCPHDLIRYFRTRKQATEYVLQDIREFCQPVSYGKSNLPIWFGRLVDKLYHKLPDESKSSFAKDIIESYPEDSDSTILKKVKWTYLEFLLHENLIRLDSIEIDSRLKGPIQQSIKLVSTLIKNAIKTGTWNDIGDFAKSNAESIHLMAEAVDWQKIIENNSLDDIESQDSNLNAGISYEKIIEYDLIYSIILSSCVAMLAAKEFESLAVEDATICSAFAEELYNNTSIKKVYLPNNLADSIQKNKLQPELFSTIKTLRELINPIPDSLPSFFTIPSNGTTNNYKSNFNKTRNPNPFIRYANKLLEILNNSKAN